MTTFATRSLPAPELPAVVGELRALTEPAIRAAVARLHPRLSAVESYHRGWTTADGRPAPGASGKALRPALAMLAARAVEGPDQQGVAAAVAVELVHDFSLLHDDVMDGDTERRHQPTAWAAYGEGAAVLSGDALLSLATEVVLESGSAHTLEGVRLLHRGVAELVAGQAMDLDFESRSDVTLDECERMAAAKTGALLGCACSLGALLAGGQPRQVEALRQFGRELGVAFQLVDDVLGIWGDAQITGKPVLADLRRRKKTLPITAALGSGGPGLEALATVLATDQATAVPEELLATAAGQLEQAGFRQWALEQAELHLAAAATALTDVDAPDDVRNDLARLAQFTVARWR